MITFAFPMPPTLNHYYGRKGNHSFIKADGKKFRAAVAEIVAAAGHPTITKRCAVFVAVYPKNRARQDIMNREKALSDAMTHAGVWEDDSLIDEYIIVRRPPIPGGMVRVVVTEIEEELHDPKDVEDRRLRLAAAV
jgi:crossover junction endodeoxyribonuclease RusA